MTTYPHAIFLNGPSSAGKTTLAQALQDALVEPYLHFGLDNVIEMMPNRLNDWSGEKAWNKANQPPGFCHPFMHDVDGSPLYGTLCGPEGVRIITLMRMLTVTIIKDYGHVIIDDVADGMTDIGPWQNVLKPYTVLWVGLTASLEVLEARERTRPNRLQGLARGQLATIHHNVPYDLFFDTSAQSIDEIVQAILTKITAP